MTQAVLIHTIQDAEHYLQSDLFGDARLFSANINVVYYLKYQHNQECGDICAYLDPEEARRTNESTLLTSNALLHELDQRIAPVLNGQLGLSMRYFTPLYSFIGARQLALYELLALALRRMIEAEQVDSVVLYEGELGPLKSSVVDFFKTVVPGIKYYTISYEEPAGRNQTIISGGRLERIADLLFFDNDGFPAFQEEVTRQQGAASRNILLFEPVNSLETLDEDFSRAGIYCFQPLPDTLKDLFRYELSCQALPNQETLDVVRAILSEERPLLVLLYKTIEKDFRRNLVPYMQVCTLYRKLHEASPVQQVYWENPPVQGAGALVLEYFMTNQQTEVTGIRSRRTFFVGQIDDPYATVTVFNRCRRFLDQGESNDNVYPANSIARPVTQSGTKKRQVVDVSLYLKPTLSFLQTGQVANHGIVQEELLGFLDSQQEQKIHVVTHALSAFSNCAMLSLMKRLGNVSWVNDVCLERYLTKYAPRLLIIDSAATLVQDVLAENAIIIIIHDASIQFNDKILALLEKNMYYAGSVKEVKRLLQLYFDGHLVRKADYDLCKSV